MRDSNIEQVESELARLESQDSITQADIERFRNVLPTDPETAKIVSKALPPPWSELFEYVSPCERQSGYWRLKPDRWRPRSERERRYREQFSAAAKKARGVEGTVKRGGKRIPKSAAEMAEELEHAQSTSDRISQTAGKALNRLRRLLR